MRNMVRKKCDQPETSSEPHKQPNAHSARPNGNYRQKRDKQQVYCQECDQDVDPGVLSRSDQDLTCFDCGHHAQDYTTK